MRHHIPPITGSQSKDFYSKKENQLMSTDNGKQIAKYADPAMWLAEPMSDHTEPVKPRAYLLHMTPNPLRALAAAAELYQGRVVRSYDEITASTAVRWFADMTKTKLAAPLEFIDFHFLLEGVTRAFTHQLVRQRTAVYVQESMRFAVKEDAAFEVGIPPSLIGLKADDPKMTVWRDAVGDLAEAYNRLINSGMPAEDARGLLPTNITTRVHYKTNLRALADHAGNRLCTQAQFEWREVWGQMIKAVREYGPEEEAWQQDLICELFKPVCYQTGRCAFRSLADRDCSIRGRVEHHWRQGVESHKWDDIDNREWLADPTAAR